MTDKSFDKKSDKNLRFVGWYRGGKKQLKRKCLLRKSLKVKPKTTQIFVKNNDPKNYSIFTRRNKKEREKKEIVKIKG